MTRRATGRAVEGRGGEPGVRVQVTLGELVAAAFDVVGGEALKVARLLSSPAMARATRRHFRFVDRAG